MPTIKHITTTSSGSRRLHNTSATTYSGVHTSLVNVTKIKRSTNHASHAARSIQPKHNLAVKTMAYNYDTLLPQSQTRVDEMRMDIYGFDMMFKSFSGMYMTTMHSITAHISLALKRCYAEHKRKYPKTDFTQERFDKAFNAAKTQLSNAIIKSSQDDMVERFYNAYYGIVSNHVNDELSEGSSWYSLNSKWGKHAIHARINDAHYGSGMFEILPWIPDAYDWSSETEKLVNKYVDGAISCLAIDVMLTRTVRKKDSPFNFSNVYSLIWAELFHGIERKYDSLDAPLRTKAIVTAGPNGVMCIA